MSIEEFQNMYDERFYETQREESLRSAEVIVPLILNVFPAESVVDIGCGVGTWLSVFRNCGVKSIRGFDVNDLPSENYFIDKNSITTRCDLSSGKFLMNVKSDLAVCLEVAEHLPDAAALELVKHLAGVSPVIVFSAAYPGQGGVNHVNEQPPWYWREKFLAHDYMEIDFLRPLIWSDARVGWWYRQNITTFVHPDYIRGNKSVLELAGRYGGNADINRLAPVNERILKMLFEQRDALAGDVREAERILKMFKRLEGRIETMKSIIDYLRKTDLSVRTSVDLGELLFNCGEMDEAEHFFHKSLATEPGNVDALNNLGVINCQRSNFAEARGYFMRALSLDPGDRAARENLDSVDQLLKTPDTICRHK